MTASRRELLVAGGCAAIAAVAPGTAACAATGEVLLTDAAEHGGAPGAAIVLAQGRFVDDALVAALRPGRYLAVLSPANALLLLEVLRVRRIAAATGEGEMRFTLGPERPIRRQA